MIPGVVAHLWQSTLFAGAAWLIVLALQRNRAEVRHWVWFAASAKFLIPFSLLVGLGTLIPHSGTAAPVRIEWPVAFQEFGEPTAIFPATTHVAVSAGTTNVVLVASAVTVWVCGFAATGIVWLRRWTHARLLRQSATVIAVPTGLKVPIPLVSAPDVIEPGIYGFLRPVLLLPEGILERLNQAQLDAILAHEFCHVRRKDNLIATIHMAVQAVFWFHPLIWWIGTRLVDERERACDEEVLRLGNEPRVYAEGILSVCKLYMESPLACVSGVTGADLKKRIELIMKNRTASRLGFTRKIVLAACGGAALAAPIVIGMINAPAIEAQSTGMARFDAASIKPISQQGPDIQGLGDIQMLPGGRLRAEKVQLRYFIQNVYSLKPFQILGGPAWINSSHYEIDAKAEGNPNASQMRLMMQTLLEERFKLKVHHETKQLPVYELVVAKGGARLSEPKEGSCVMPDQNDSAFPPSPGQPLDCGRVRMMMSPAGAQIRGGKVSMPELVRILSNALAQTVVDKTGINRTFDVQLDFTPDGALAGVPPPPAPSPSSDPVRSAPSPDSHGNIFGAIQEQLGLRLKSTKGPVDVLVIDSIERPSAN
jgi:uncharacterized protein (TIGR03435 family)